MSRVLLILVLMMAVGCKSNYYHPRFPVLERPERPKLANVPGSEMKKMSPAARKDVADNFNNLLGNSNNLEAAVDTYNEHAKKQRNWLLRYSRGLKKERISTVWSKNLQTTNIQGSTKCRIWMWSLKPTRKNTPAIGW